MPNWCEGIAKFRGSYENIAKFFKEGIHCWEYDFKTTRDILIKDAIVYEETDDSLYIEITRWAHIDGTKRAFLDEQPINVSKPDEDELIIVLADIRQAWDLQVDDFVEISKKYGIDIRINGYECGMQFNQLIEIINGAITINDTIAFKDYDWECPCPNVGG